MIKTFTQNDVVAAVYNDKKKNELDELNQILLFDEELSSFTQDVCKIKQELDNAVLSPSQSTVDKILEYSRNYK